MFISEDGAVNVRSGWARKKHSPLRRALRGWSNESEPSPSLTAK
jgi:hypothetical protein